MFMSNKYVKAIGGGKVHFKALGVIVYHSHSHLHSNFNHMLLGIPSSLDALVVFRSPIRNLKFKQFQPIMTMAIDVVVS